MIFLWLFCYAWLTLVLLDLEPEPPLFNPQNEGTLPNYGYYLTCSYPRPDYWVDRFLRVVGWRSE